MDFALRRPGLAAVAVLTTSALLGTGNGMEPRWPLMWVAFLPILGYAVTEESALLTGVGAALAMLLGSYPMFGYLHGVLHAPVLAWLAPFSVVSLLFAADVLLFRALVWRGAIVSAAVALPSFWVIVEYLGSFVPANGTAGELAYTQLKFLPLLQLASVTGPWGITFVLLLFPSALVAGVSAFRAHRRRASVVLAGMFAVLAAALVFGMLRLSARTPAGSVRVGLLATDTVEIAEPGPAAERLLREYAGHAEELARAGARVVVMPEKVAIVRDADLAHADPVLQAAADRTGATLIVGVLRLDLPSRFNEARVYRPHLAMLRYDKQHMLPLFEGDLTPGSSLLLLEQASVGVAICKDMDFIRPARDYGRAGVALVLDPAWDFEADRAWHGHIAIMRGVEDGYAIAHAAKRGLLTVTDDRGRILAEVRSGSAPFATLLVDVPMRHDDTVFSRLGAWFPWLTGVLMLALLLPLLLSAVVPSIARRSRVA